MLEKVVEKTNFADAFIITVSSFALICFWRGAWGLLDLYLFPGNPRLSFWVSISIGLVVLFLIALYRKDHHRRAAKAMGQ